jgi:RNA polymerase sigma-70 factor, ECF subfamily
MPAKPRIMDPQELSAQELVQLCLDVNQKAAWEEFVRRYQPVIARVVMRTTRRWAAPLPALVDDLVHETYLKLMANGLRALRELELNHEKAIFGFLKAVASNVVMDHFRGEDSEKRGGRWEAVSLEHAAFFVASPRGGTRMADRELLVHEIDVVLKSQQSDPNFVRDYCIFWLYFRDGFTAKAISELPSIELKVKGVESTLLRLTKLVRSRMSSAAGR